MSLKESIHLKDMFGETRLIINLAENKIERFPTEDNVYMSAIIEILDLLDGKEDAHVSDEDILRSFKFLTSFGALKNISGILIQLIQYSAQNREYIMSLSKNNVSYAGAE